MTIRKHLNWNKLDTVSGLPESEVCSSSSCYTANRSPRACADRGRGSGARFWRMDEEEQLARAIALSLEATQPAASQTRESGTGLLSEQHIQTVEWGRLYTLLLNMRSCIHVYLYIYIILQTHSPLEADQQSVASTSQTLITTGSDVDYQWLPNLDAMQVRLNQLDCTDLASMPACS